MGVTGTGGIGWNSKPAGGMTMRFMMMVKSAENQGPPPQELMEAMGKHVQEALKFGQMIASGGLAPTGMSKRVRLERGQITVTDGPFAESKEVVGGFAIMEFDSQEKAVESALGFIELHRKHWPSWEGVSEIRQVLGPED
jgi:hypothetical protein